EGRVVDGDAVLLMCGIQLKREHRLKGNAIVATVMSNIGLELALRSRSIELVRTSVGDKYVMEEMLKRGLSLGGEQSGHIIFSEYLFTGDGLCTALNVLRTVVLTGRTLADLAADLTTYPQVLLNVRVKQKVDLKTVPAIASVLEPVEVRLDAGAQGITVHPRADRRHITPEDVRAIATALRLKIEPVEYNIEGDPRPDLIDLVEDVRPDQCTLVPVVPGEITSQAGWQPGPATEALPSVIGRLHACGTRISLFVDASPDPIRWAASVGADRIALS